MTRLNVVVVYLDDAPPPGWIDKMPYLGTTLDASHGSVVRFPNSICNHPLCGPARSVMLTGRYSSSTGVTSNNGEPITSLEAGMDTRTYLPVRLRKAGYRTGHFGKPINHYPWNEGDTYIQPGWDQWCADTAGGGTYYNYDWNVNGTVTSKGADPDDYVTDVINDAAVSWLETVQEPFYAYVSHHSPHINQDLVVLPAPRHDGLYSRADVTDRPNFNPSDAEMVGQPRWLTARTELTPQEEDEQRDIIANGWSALRSVDEGIESIVDTLSSRGMLDRTVIIVTTDNGNACGSHRWLQKNRPLEESVLANVVVRWPGATSGTNDAIISDIDIPVTIADIASAPPGPVAPDGMSFRGLMEGETTEHRRAGFAMFPFVDSGQHRWAMLRQVEDDGTIWKFYTGEPVDYEIRKALYNITADPYEMNNLQATNSAKADEMYADLLRVIPSSYRDLFV